MPRRAYITQLEADRLREERDRYRDALLVIYQSEEAICPRLARLVLDGKTVNEAYEVLSAMEGAGDVPELESSGSPDNPFPFEGEIEGQIEAPGITFEEDHE